MSALPLGGLLLLGTLTVLWGGNWPAMKVALREVDVWTFRTICLGVGGAGLLALARAGGQSLRVPRDQRWPLCVVAFFNITAWHLCSAYGLTLIQAGRAAILGYTMPLWTVVFGRLLMGERITRDRFVALGLGLLGLATLLAPETRALRAAPAGTLVMLAAAMAWAIGTVLTKAHRWTIPTALLTGWQVALGGVPIVVGEAIRLAVLSHRGAPLWPAAPSLVAILGTAYATFVGALFCHWAWFRLIGILPASVAAIGTLGIPIVGLFGSALLLGERVGWPEVGALVLVVSGLAVLVLGLRGTASESPPGARAVSRPRRQST